jgi:hypothetical protein
MDEEDKSPTMRAVESQNRQAILLLEFSTHQNPVEIYETTATRECSYRLTYCSS